MLLNRTLGIAVFLSATSLCCSTLLAQSDTPVATHTNKAAGDSDRQSNPLRQLEIARAYERLDDVSAALAAFREYLLQADPGSDRVQRSEAQGRVAALAARLAERGLQQVSVQTTPRGATVMIDGKELGSSPFYVDLKPGSHRIEFRLAGYQAAAYEFELPLQQPLNIAVGLVAIRGGAAVARKNAVPDPAAASVAAPAATASAAPAPAGSSPAEEGAVASAPTQSEAAASELDAPAAASVAATTGDSDPGRKTMRTLGFVALGASVAALGGAMALEIMRSQSESDARQEREQVGFARALDKMHSRQTAARVVAGIAGVFAVTGGILLAVVASGDVEAEPAREGVALGCSREGCEASYRGAF